MKQEEEVGIELAGQCSFTESFRQAVWTKEDCTPCAYDLNKMNTSQIFSTGTQDSGCSTCANIYFSRFNGYIEEFLFEQYCKSYIYIKPKPVAPPPPPPVVVVPDPTPVVKNETDTNSTNGGTKEPEKEIIRIKTEARAPVGSV